MFGDFTNITCMHVDCGYLVTMAQYCHWVLWSALEVQLCFGKIDEQEYSQTVVAGLQ